jgi:hypothetical protein
MSFELKILLLCVHQAVELVQLTAQGAEAAHAGCCTILPYRMGLAWMYAAVALPLDSPCST